MEVRRQSSAIPHTRLHSVCILRRVKEQQEPFRRFVTTLAQHAGCAAIAGSLHRAHLTILPATPVDELLADRGYTPEARSAFSLAIRTHLHRKLSKGYTSVTIDARKPLRWVGAGNILALTVAPTSEVLDHRGEAETFLKKELGVTELPSPLDVYNPHIALGQVRWNRISEQERLHPETLLGHDICPLGSVVLRGLPDPSVTAPRQYAGAVA